MSNARAPKSTGAPSFVSRLSLADRVNGPKKIVSLVRAAGVFIGVVFTLRTV